MPKYTLSMTVAVDMEFATDDEAIEYIENHTVFDLLDIPGSQVGDDTITQEVEGGASIRPVYNYWEGKADE